MKNSLAKNLILVSGLFMSLMSITYQSWLPSIYSYLDVAQPPRPANLLVVLGGHSYRAATAAELYHDGYASQILISGNEENISESYNMLIERQIPKEDIVIVEGANNTWDEARLNIEYMRANGIQSALLITTRPHTRRAQAIYDTLNDGHKIELTTVAALYDNYDSSDWWQSSSLRNFVFREYSKMVFYVFRYGVWSWG